MRGQLHVLLNRCQTLIFYAIHGHWVHRFHNHSISSFSPIFRFKSWQEFRFIISGAKASLCRISSFRHNYNFLIDESWLNFKDNNVLYNDIHQPRAINVLRGCCCVKQICSISLGCVQFTSGLKSEIVKYFQTSSKRGARVSANESLLIPTEGKTPPAGRLATSFINENGPKVRLKEKPSGHRIETLDMRWLEI